MNYKTYIKKILSIGKRLAFEAKLKSPFFTYKLKQTPIIINNRNRYTYLLSLIEWLEKAGLRNIHIIDNASTYPPLLKYYQTTKYKVHALKENVGYLALWETDIHKQFIHDYYAYTDADVVPLDECPKNFLRLFVKVLHQHPKVDKVGFGLKIDDLPDCYALKNDVIELEKKWWSVPLPNNLYEASIDTTFALYRPSVQGGYWLRAIRTGYPYMARHMPWYVDTQNLPKEEEYYKLNASSHSYWLTKLKEVDSSLDSNTN